MMFWFSLKKFVGSKRRFIRRRARHLDTGRMKSYLGDSRRE